MTTFDEVEAGDDIPLQLIDDNIENPKGQTEADAMLVQPTKVFLET